MGDSGWVGILLPLDGKAVQSRWMWGPRGLCRHRGCSSCFLQDSPASCLVESFPVRTSSLRLPSLDFPGLPAVGLPGAAVILGVLVVRQCWHVSIYRALSHSLRSLKAGSTHAQRTWPVISFRLKPFTQPVSQQSGRADLVCLHWEN